MKNLKKLGAVIALTFAVATSAAAGISETPPRVPGDTNSPPCAMAQTSDDSGIPGETSTPPAANAVSEFSFTDLALDVIETALLLF